MGQVTKVHVAQELVNAQDTKRLGIYSDGTSTRHTNYQVSATLCAV
jgi:hypothetical protein